MSTLTSRINFFEIAWILQTHQYSFYLRSIPRKLLVTEVFLLSLFVIYVHPGALFIFHFLYDFNSSQICSSHIRFSLIWLLITLDLFAASTWTICDSKFADGVLMPYKFSTVYSGTDLNLLIWIILVIILFDSMHWTFYLFNLIYLIIALWYVGCLGQDTCRWR